MNNELNPLLIEMFDGCDLSATPPLELPNLDAAIREIDERPQHSWAGGSLVREVVFQDFVRAVLGDVPELPAPTVPVRDEFVKEIAGEVVALMPKALPTKPGYIPTSRPTTSTGGRATSRGKWQQALQAFRTTLEGAGYRFNAEAETLFEELNDLVNEYVERCVRDFA